MVRQIPAPRSSWVMMKAAAPASGLTEASSQLASAISLALVTTFEGLIVAIPTMAAFSFFRSRIDSIVAEAGKKIEQVMMPLGRKR